MTNVVIASDSFKGSATSVEIADYLETGIHNADPATIVQKVPIADGGEGTVYCVIQATDGQLLTTKVCGPLGDTVTATWGMIDTQTAIIETAEAAGLTLVNNELDVNRASTYGVGQLIKMALNRGAKTIYVGLGGSATNDGGVGMAQALGGHFYDSEGNELQHGAEALSRLESIDLSGLDERLTTTDVIGLSDVNNPLTGENGATRIFGPQKGATEAQITVLDDALGRLANLVKTTYEIDLADAFGAGAAGGLGYGLLAFCQGKIRSGIREVIKLVKLDEKMLDAKLVITGEGQIDGQSLGGKVPIGVAALAKEHRLPVVAIVGSIGAKAEGVYEHGIDLVLSTTTRPMSVQEAISQVPELVVQAGFNLMKTIQLGEKMQSNLQSQTEESRGAG